MHGVFHRRASGFGEFSGDKHWYTELLLHFRNDLENKIGRAVTTFVPPWNIIAHPYLESIVKAGFTVASGGPTPSSFKLFANVPILFVPFSTEPSVLQELSQDLSLAHGDFLAVPLWHHYNISLAALRPILEALSSNPHIRFLSFSSAAHRLGSPLSSAAYSSINAYVQTGRQWVYNTLQHTPLKTCTFYQAWRTQQLLYLGTPPLSIQRSIPWRLVASLADSLSDMRAIVARHKNRLLGG
jgi:hypothetical protein